MRKIIILLTILLANTALAQPLSVPKLKRSNASLYIFLNGGALLQANGKDLKTPATGALTVENTTGMKAGLEMVFIPRRKVPVFLNAGLEYRRAPQLYKLNYSRTISGLQADANTDVKFVVNSVAFRLAPGYAFRLSGNSHIDVAAGLLFDAAVNRDATNGEEGIYVDDNTTGYKQLAAYRYTGFSNKDDDISLPANTSIGLNTMYFVSASYRLNMPAMRNRAIRIGAEYARTIAGNRVSKTTMLYLDKNRNVIGKDVVMDKGACVSVFVGISI